MISAFLALVPPNDSMPRLTDSRDQRIDILWSEARGMPRFRRFGSDGAGRAGHRKRSLFSLFLSVASGGIELSRVLLGVC